MKLLSCITKSIQNGNKILIGQSSLNVGLHYISRTDLNIIFRSHPEVFYKVDVLKNFAKLTGKHQCQSLFFNKIARLKSSEKDILSLVAVSMKHFLKFSSRFSSDVISSCNCFLVKNIFLHVTLPLNTGHTLSGRL